MEYICQSRLEQLTESEKASSEGCISCNEAKEELIKMAKNKTPGNDGITVEFYEVFWPLVSKYMIDFDFVSLYYQSSIKEHGINIKELHSHRHIIRVVQVMAHNCQSRAYNTKHMRHKDVIKHDCRDL